MRKILPLAMLVSVACGDTYNNTYVNKDGEEVSADSEEICRDVCTRLYQCDPSNEDPEYTCIRPCIELNYPTDYPEWIDCVYQNECNSELSNICEKL